MIILRGQYKASLNLEMHGTLSGKIFLPGQKGYGNSGSDISFLPERVIGDRNPYSRNSICVEKELRPDSVIRNFRIVQTEKRAMNSADTICRIAPGGLEKLGSSLYNLHLYKALDITRDYL